MYKYCLLSAAIYFVVIYVVAKDAGTDDYSDHMTHIIHIITVLELQYGDRMGMFVKNIEGGK